ncbi:MAG: hypothetical protein LRY76_03650 [Alphaproteobacteria bacterium]|nr:hypothetical protein [Alphaproteobacteria bacterium]
MAVFSYLQNLTNHFWNTNKTPETVVLDEATLAGQAAELFAGATPAKKKVAPATVLRNDSATPITFNVVLKDGTIENTGSSIPPGGVAVVQVGGEINVMREFEKLYEDVQEGIAAENVAHADEAIVRAGIPADQAATLTRLTATSKQRVDQYLKLPADKKGNSVNFVIMKPWGPDGSLVPQNAKSGDTLVFNGAKGDIYFNSVSGTLGNFVNAETGAPIPEELATMKTAPLATLRAGRVQGADLQAGAAPAVGR